MPPTYQSWQIINIDKLQTAGGFLGGMGLFFWGSNSSILKLLYSTPVPSSENDAETWAGDRIICLGDGAVDLPPGVITKSDTMVLTKLRRAVENSHESKQNKSGRPSKLAYYLNKAVTDAATRGRPPTVQSSQLARDAFPENAVWVLRNISKKLFVRSDTVFPPFYRANKHDAFEAVPGLYQVLVMRTAWSESPCSSMAYTEDSYRPRHGGEKKRLNRGTWAGDRFDVVMLTAEVEGLCEQGWKDISQEAARDLDDICESEEYYNFEVVYYDRE